MRLRSAWGTNLPTELENLNRRFKELAVQKGINRNSNDEVHQLSARIAELEKQKLKYQRLGLTCFKCEKQGHMAKDCRVRQGVTCNYCHKQEHVESECRTKQYQGQRNNAYRSQPQNRNNGNNI